MLDVGDRFGIDAGRNGGNLGVQCGRVHEGLVLGLSVSVWARQILQMQSIEKAVVSNGQAESGIGF
jgi:hypothetical protein